MANLDARQSKALSDLESTSEVDEIRWDKKSKSPKYISGKLTPSASPVASDADAVGVARKFLEEAASLNALPDDALEDLAVADVATDQDGFRHITFQQKLNDVEVFEGSIQVHIDPQGQVVKYKANRATALPSEMDAKVGRDDAVKVAAEKLAIPPSSKKPPEANLELFQESEDESRLAWHVLLFSDEDFATYHAFIDAIGGSLLYSYNDARHLQRIVYDAEMTEDLPAVRLLLKEGAESHPDSAAWNAYENAGIVYQYFANQFGRNSYDGKGSPLVATVHFGNKVNNAYWRSGLQQMIYGDGDGVSFSSLAAALDIVGHELTHAVASTTARFIYAEQAGALDESFADLFGVMVTNKGEITDWQIGEAAFTPRRSGDALRYVDDPPRGKQPDHMDGFKPLNPGEFPNRANDNGYVHYNSGIPNKAAYLIVTGGTHNGVTVTGMGRADAERILFLAMTAYLYSATDSRWTFKQARIAMVDASRQLFPGDSARETTIMDAWAAVGVR